MTKQNDTPSNFIAFGFDLVGFEPLHQMTVYQYLVEKADVFRRSLGRGAHFKVNIACGLMQISFHCDELEKAAKRFLEMLMRGEIKIPGERVEAPIKKYVVPGQYPPIFTLIAMATDDRAKDAISIERRQALVELF